MTAEDVTAFVARSRAGYVAELMATGVPEADAARVADRQIAVAFRDGARAPGHLLFRILVDDADVGHVWIGPEPDAGDAAWWIWDIEIADDARGRGLGREALRLVEFEAKRHGATTLGLNVFGSNDVARRLYETTGYQVTSLRMRKHL